MLLRTHIVFGIFAGIFLFGIVSNLLLFFMFLLFGIVIVDIDTKKSKVGRNWFFRPLQFFVRHRGILHTFILCILFSGLIYFFSKSAGIGFFVGYFSHLTLDCLTCSGLMLFWPFSNKKLKFKIKTGGLIEEILFVIILLFDIFLTGRILISKVF